MDREKIVKKIRESKLSENDVLLYGSVLINEYAKTYHKKQLKLYDVVNSKNVLNELYIAYNWHNQQMKEVEPLSRDYFIHYGRREGVRNAIEIITGEEM